MTAPMRCISSNVKRSPRATLHGKHDGATLPLVCGRELSMRSSPRGRSVVPQCTQGFKIKASTSPEVRSQASVRWYAFRRKIARPLSVLPYRFLRSMVASRCSGVRLLHLSLRRSRPAFLARWHNLHSYESPEGRVLSPRKNSRVSGNTALHLWHFRDWQSLAGLAFTWAHLVSTGPNNRITCKGRAA